jgi:hypothetical protein
LIEYVLGTAGDTSSSAVTNSGSASTSIISLYNCNIDYQSDQSELDDGAGILIKGVSVGGAGDVYLYGCTIVTSATSKDNENASAVSLTIAADATGDMYAYNTVVLGTTADAGSGTSVALDYANLGGAGSLVGNGSWGDFTKVSDESSGGGGVIPVTPLNPPVVLTVDTDLGTLPNGVTITNKGASGPVAHTMPPAIAGATIAFIDDVKTAGADVAAVCAGTDVMMDPSDDTATFTRYDHTIDKWGIVGWECFSDGYWHMLYALGATE